MLSPARQVFGPARNSNFLLTQDTRPSPLKRCVLVLFGFHGVVHGLG